MPRSPAFDEQEVVENAMRIFWKKGYTDTSIKDLIEATRLQPGSLYGAFTNKKTLFVYSLEKYYENMYTELCLTLDLSVTTKEKIELFLERLINKFESDEEQKSCLLLNTLLEKSVDEDIKNRIKQMFMSIERKFYIALKQAQDCGEISNENQANDLAKLIMSCIYGLQVYNQLQKDTESLRKIAHNILLSIK